MMGTRHWRGGWIQGINLAFSQIKHPDKLIIGNFVKHSLGSGGFRGQEDTTHPAEWHWPGCSWWGLTWSPLCTCTPRPPRLWCPPPPGPRVRWGRSRRGPRTWTRHSIESPCSKNAPARHSWGVDISMNVRFKMYVFILTSIFSKENLSYDHMSTAQTWNRLKAPKDKMYLCQSILK